MNKLRTFLCAGLLLITPLIGWAAPVNINTASASELSQAIKGVGEKKAEAIILYREKHGPFSTIEQLARVKGIGEKTIEKNRENMTIE